MTNYIEISDFKIDIVRKEIKNMHLSVYPPTGRVRIAVPLSVSDDVIRLFAISKLSWIKKNQRQFEDQERQSARVLLERESHYFEGRRYLLRITEREGAPSVFLKNKTHIDLFVRPKTTAEQRQSILNDWYRKQLKNQIPALIAKWEQILNVKVNNWGVKQMKTKWGTCNIEAQRIWINLELAKKSSPCLDYIVLHEMVHLLVRRHNDQFLYYMDKYLPNWRQIKTELNTLPLSYID